MYCMSLDRLVYFFLQTFLCKEKWLLNHTSILERNRDSQLPWEEKVGFWNEAGFHLFLQLQFDIISPFPVYSPDLNSLFSSIVVCYCLWNNRLFFDCFPTGHLQCFPVDFLLFISICSLDVPHPLPSILSPMGALLVGGCTPCMVVFQNVIFHCSLSICYYVSLVNCILPCFPFLSYRIINSIDCFHMMLHLSQWFIESL